MEEKNTVPLKNWRKPNNAATVAQEETTYEVHTNRADVAVDIGIVLDEQREGSEPGPCELINLQR